MPSLQKPAAVLLFGAAALSLLGADAFSARAAGQGAAPAQGEKKTAVDEKAIRALIAHLAAESFDKREAAHKRLAEIGGPALEPNERHGEPGEDDEEQRHEPDAEAVPFPSHAERGHAEDDEQALRHGEGGLWPNA